MHNKALTDNHYLQRTQREQALEEVAAQSAKTATWLRQLIEREDRLSQEGNAYGELYSQRQFGLAVAPIVQREVTRARILATTRARGLTLTEIAEKLAIPPPEVMPHVVALRRRGQLVMEKVEDEVTPVYRAPEQPEQAEEAEAS